MTSIDHSTQAGQSWVEAELQRVANERGEVLSNVTWLRESDEEMFQIRFSIGGNAYQAPIVREDLEYAVRDESVQTWLANHLRKTVA